MTPLRTVAVLCLLSASAACGMANNRAVVKAAQADSPGCPEEQIHVVGPMEVEGAGLVYEVRVCDRDRYYEDATPDDGKREFVRRGRPEGVGGNAGLWAETDGVEAPEEQAAPSGASDGDDTDDFDL